MKLPAHRAGLPGNEISFLIVPLDPAYKAGLAGHLPATYQTQWVLQTSCAEISLYNIIIILNLFGFSLRDFLTIIENDNPVT